MFNFQVKLQRVLNYFKFQGHFQDSNTSNVIIPPSAPIPLPLPSQPIPIIPITPITPNNTPNVGGLADEWMETTIYPTGTLVEFEGVIYECIQSHTSHNGWKPSATVDILWKRITPSQSVSSLTLPSETVPSLTLPSETVSSLTLPSEMVPSLTLPSETVSSLTVSDISAGVNSWRAGTSYQVGDSVERKGTIYKALISHVSHMGWKPEETVNIVWKLASESTVLPVSSVVGSVDVPIVSSGFDFTDISVDGLPDKLYGVYNVGDVLEIKGVNIEGIYFSNKFFVKKLEKMSFKIIKPYSSSLKVKFLDGSMRLFGVFTREFLEMIRDPKVTKVPLVGGVSEDAVSSMKFWSEFNDSIQETSKYLHIRYIYLNGGPLNGWRTNWGGAVSVEEEGMRAKKFIRNSLRLGMITCFVYYNIPDGGESYHTNLQHIQSRQYMDAYFKDLDFVLNLINRESLDVPVYMVMEPDFIGYLQQLSGKGQVSAYYKYADEIQAFTGGLETYVNKLFPENVKGLVEGINYMIKQKCKQVVLGWQINVWSSGYSGKTIPGNSLMRVSDNIKPLSKAIEFIKKEAKEIADYYMKAGCGYLTDFISFDKYGLDFRAVSSQIVNNPWAFNSDHWHNYLEYISELVKVFDKPTMIWQAPEGHLNSSQTTNPYTGQIYVPLKNVHNCWEDSSGTFFLGDRFKPSEEEWNHWSENQYKIKELMVNNMIQWPPMIDVLLKYGVFSILFGAGVGASTHTLGTIAAGEDGKNNDHWLISKIQMYWKRIN